MLTFHIRRTLKMGVKSLWLHKMRSCLTMLGIVFGVCSVIAMLAIGEGAGQEAQEQIRLLGSQNIILRSVKPPDDEQSATEEQGMLIQYGLTYADAERIQSTLPGVQVIAAARVIREDLWNGARRISSRVMGVAHWHHNVANLRVSRGRFFGPVEVDARANVAAIGADVAERLFPIDDPIGRTVRVGEGYFRIIGVMEPIRSAGGGAGMSEARPGNSDIFIPLTTANNRFGEIMIRQTAGAREAEQVELHEITVRVDDLDAVLPTSRAIRAILQRFHDQTDYEILVPLELLRQAEATKRIFNIVLGSIAAISLVVGGIGIMNIMLATVTERTREIGVRRAMGAKRRDIITQFLTETVLLSGTGGMIGIVLGLVIPFAVSRLTDMATVITPWSLILAFGISVGIGIVFGLYPARRAAEMDPIEALRHE